MLHRKGRNERLLLTVLQKQLLDFAEAILPVGLLILRRKTIFAGRDTRFSISSKSKNQGSLFSGNPIDFRYPTVSIGTS